MSLSAQNSSVSSENCTTLQNSVKFLFKSFMFRLKTRGSKTVISGTLWRSEIQLDSIFFTIVFCCLLFIKL